MILQGALRRRASGVLGCLALVACATVVAASPVSVRDLIEMTELDAPDFGIGGHPLFSPDGRYVVFMTATGDLEEDVLNYRLWLWRTDDIAAALRVRAGSGGKPRPLLLTTVPGHDSRAVADVQWLEDSSGVLLRKSEGQGKYALVIVDARSGREMRISARGQDVGRYAKLDARNGRFAYAVASPLVREARERDFAGVQIAGTGRSIYELLFPFDDTMESSYDWGELWIFERGKRRRVAPSSDGERLHVNHRGPINSALALSPDGSTLVTSLASGDSKRSRFVAIDVESGVAHPVIDAPDGPSGGVNEPLLGADWSPDGKWIALTNTFIRTPPASGDLAARPCLAIVEVRTRSATCVETVTLPGDSAYASIRSFRFDKRRSDRVIVQYYYGPPDAPGSSSRAYTRSRDGAWEREPDASATSSAKDHSSVGLVVEQGPNDPPRLVAVDRQTGASLVLLDPNANLRDKQLDRAESIAWQDEHGRSWEGLLLPPNGMKQGQRYPLVLQAHGYPEDQSRFMASGAATSAFAARPLAAAGIAVLQINTDWQSCRLNQPDEVACELEGYASALQMVMARGWVDADRVGLIGFSRTNLYTLAAATDPRFRFAAATVNDGVMLSYLQYLASADYLGSAQTSWMDSTVGEPFRGNLQRWLSQSPIFRLERLQAPLRVEAVGRSGLLFMWEPYATLRFLKKPVDLILIQEGTHPLTNPAQRFASQQGNVDWFRFWLQDYVDPAPGKTEQYRRWSEMKRRFPINGLQ